LENVIHRVATISASRVGPIDAEDIDRAIKFDPANYLITNDLIERLRDLFREGAVQNTPLTLEVVNRLLAEVFESELGAKQTKELLQVGDEKLRSMKGKKRDRAS
jgi:hypothetical protein